MVYLGNYKSLKDKPHNLEKISGFVVPDEKKGRIIIPFNNCVSYFGMNLSGIKFKDSKNLDRIFLLNNNTSELCGINIFPETNNASNFLKKESFSMIAGLAYLRQYEGLNVSQLEECVFYLINKSEFTKIGSKYTQQNPILYFAERKKSPISIPFHTLDLR